MTTSLTGGCNCGAVRFEITEPPDDGLPRFAERAPA
jgi:hypothetical protein